MTHVIICSHRSLLAAKLEETMPIGVQTKLLINNHFVNSVAGKTFKTANPTDESVCTSRE